VLERVGKERSRFGAAGRRGAHQCSFSTVATVEQRGTPVRGVSGSRGGWLAVQGGAGQRCGPLDGSSWTRKPPELADDGELTAVVEADGMDLASGSWLAVDGGNGPLLGGYTAHNWSFSGSLMRWLIVGAERRSSDGGRAGWRMERSRVAGKNVFASR
jgi:hypothetical protein